MQGPKTYYDDEAKELPTVSHSDYLMPSELDADTDPLAMSLEWEDELDEPDDDEWDEPEPFAEYDSELQQSLYVIGERDDAALGVELKIDQWVAQVDDVSATQGYSIVLLLKEFGHGRIRRWLPWLGKQQWTGESLLLFLRFRTHWESNPHWWEYSYWDWRAHCWQPTRSRYSLSLEDTYELVHHRSDYRPHEVIDETWLADWLDLTLWQYGFRSFASFALFRAGFGGGTNWMRQIDWYAQEQLRTDEPSARWRNWYKLYHYGPPLWFSEQNWYEPSEWHDNLGW